MSTPHMTVLPFLNILVNSPIRVCSVVESVRDAKQRKIFVRPWVLPRTALMSASYESTRDPTYAHPFAEGRAAGALGERQRNCPGLRPDITWAARASWRGRSPKDGASRTQARGSTPSCQQPAQTSGGRQPVVLIGVSVLR